MQTLASWRAFMRHAALPLPHLRRDRRARPRGPCPLTGLLSSNWPYRPRRRSTTRSRLHGHEVRLHHRLHLVPPAPRLRPPGPDHHRAASTSSHPAQPGNSLVQHRLPTLCAPVGDQTGREAHAATERSIRETRSEDHLPGPPIGADDRLAWRPRHLVVGKSVLLRKRRSRCDVASARRPTTLEQSAATSSQQDRQRRPARDALARPRASRAYVPFENPLKPSRLLRLTLAAALQTRQPAMPEGG